MTARREQESALSRGRVFEPLEPRLLLDAEGVLAGADMHLTLSFAPDGAEIAGQLNSLAATLDPLAAATNPDHPTGAWQATILQAFQTWAVETNADIGVMSDGGQAFGVAGPTQGDARFGDIRVGAVAMKPSVGAVSVPTDGLVAGTWYADVVFNTAFHFRSLDDLYAIALHEAGNVFGLKDSTDPSSPLSTSDPPVVKPPTAADLAALQALHGTRAADANEAGGDEGPATSDNDSFARATQLKAGEFPDLDAGSTPTVVYGDITTASDVDFFSIRGPGDYYGPLTATVRTAGISLLTPKLTVFDSSEQLVGEAVATDLGGDVAEYQIPTLTPGADYYLRVSGASPGAFDRGGYSLAVVFNGRNVVEQPMIDKVAGGAYRFLSVEEIADLFEGDSDDELYGDDKHSDDEPDQALELETVPGFVPNSRYQVVASIADATDVDYFAIQSPDVEVTGLDVLTATLRSLDAGGLVPKLRLLDDEGAEIPAVILANGNGETIIQSTAVHSSDDVWLEVSAADPGGFFDTGNYELIAAFGPTATQVTALASATIGNGVAQRTHTLYVGEPQLFHFALQADAVATATPTVLFASVVDDAGTTVYQLATQPGATRTGPAALLAPGTYNVEIAATTLDNSDLPEFGYTISGTAISDPFVGDPVDPTSNPFICPDPEMAGFFCYPGNPPIVSPNPFLWDAFIFSLPDLPSAPDQPTLINLLLGDWWRWVWNAMGTNGPVLANNDAFHTAAETPLTASDGAGGAADAMSLTVPRAAGVLGNDVDPESGTMAAMLTSDVSHGTLNLQLDGGFVYQPDPGFTGMDQFTYRVTDFVNLSNVGVAKIIVGDSGDFDASGIAAGADFLAWQRGYGVASGATLAEGDADIDGAVAGADLAIWSQQFGVPPNIAVVSADGDGSGSVAGGDFLIWQRGVGTTVGATTSTGDYTGDGAVDSADLAQWSLHFGDGAPPAQAAAATTYPLEAVQSVAGSLASLAASRRPMLSVEQLALGSADRSPDASASRLVSSTIASPAPPWIGAPGSSFETSPLAALTPADNDSGSAQAQRRPRRHEARDVAFAAWGLEAPAPSPDAGSAEFS